MKELIKKIAILLLFTTGVLILTYPFYIHALNNIVDQFQADKIQQTLSERQRKERLAQKKEENERVRENGLLIGADPFSEGSENELTGKEYREHLVGTVNIPQISINIPLFDKTNARFLEKGATILSESSFPSKEIGTHTIISAHSGLPERRLFTDLEKLELGDMFVLFVLGEKLAYEVDSINVVKPDDTSILELVEDKNLATLVTCTPYSINSHRLLVTGHRVPYNSLIEQQVEKQNKQSKWLNMLMVTGVVLFFIIVIICIVRMIRSHVRRI